MRSFLLSLLLSVSTLIGASSAAAPRASASPAEPLVPERQFPLAQHLVLNYLSEYHYARRPVDDALSAQIFDRYLEALDANRNYLLASDVAALDAKYRSTLDDSLRKDDLAPAYAIYEIYRQRLEERLAFVMKQLEADPDFTVQEEFHFDREGAAWAKGAAELDDFWRKRVKNDLIGLLLAGKTGAEARDIVRKRYETFLRRARQVNSRDVFDTFVNAYTQTLDPHTSYLSPRDADEFAIRMSLTYQGIGAQLQMQDDYVTVARLLPGGSAEKTGALAPKDRITAVGQGAESKDDLVDVIGWRLDDVVEMIRGPKDTVVRLRILPGEAAPGSLEKLVTLTRSEIKLEEQAAKQDIVDVKRDDQALKIGVIKVPAFYMDFRGRQSGAKDYRSTTRDVRKLVEELAAAKVDGIVIDLRDNGGGSLSEAAELTGLFIDRGPVVQLRTSGGKIDVLEDPEPGVAYAGPLAVLVNRFSASASEIFAGAIQDYGRGVVVGTTTFGKGTIQNLLDLDRFMPGDANLGQVKLTVGKFYRVTGSSTQHRGVVPDVELPSTIDLDEFGESAQPSALPWDQIGGTPHAGVRVARDLLPTLTKQHERRAANDREYGFFLSELARMREFGTRKSVSLNLAERREEQAEDRAERLARENARRAILGQTPLASLEDDPADSTESRDILLQETAEILADTLTLTGGNLAVVSPRALVKLR